MKSCFQPAGNRLRACLKKGGTGNLPVPAGNLPTGTSVSITCQRVAPPCSERFPHSVGRVARRNRQVACATRCCIFKQALTAVAAVLIAVSTVHAADDAKTFAEVAAQANRPAGFPRPSAVCFSSRWKHPTGPKDPYDTFQTAADFHATGFYWISGPNQEWFKEIKRHGYTVQGWLSTILPDKLFGNTRRQGRIMNEKGELVAAPWMRAWNGVWGCFNSPEYRAVYLDYVKMYLDAGVDSLHMDDPGENYTAMQWGGCHCPHCKAKAARLGKSPPDIQKESTEEFYRYIRAEMDAYARRHVPFSCNSHPGARYFFDPIFDFGLEELSERHAQPNRLYQAVRDAESRGKAQMFTFVSTNRALTRATISLAYACGTQIIVPWDVYIGTGAPRYFGTPQEYADLYGFARAAAAQLDGYEDAAFLIPEAPDDRYPEPPIAVSGGSPNLSLFVRAVPGEADRPVVIHCVDGDANPKPFHLRINPARFFHGRPVTIDFLKPAPYDRAAHARAEQTRDYTALAVRQRLAQGYVLECEVPAVSPWGLVVISPAPATPGVWPPLINADTLSQYRALLTVKLASATPDATIRYTLDGTEPSASAPVYRAPLAIAQDATVKARAFTRDLASAAAKVAFHQTGKGRTLTLPDTVPGLSLWLRADDLLASHRPGDPVPRWPAKAGPAMATPAVKLYDGRMPTPPVLAAGVINGRPAVRFTNDTALLSIRDFANENLGKAFTIFMVTRAEDSLFGACGNALNGNGGLPRLYLMRESLTYNATSLPVKATPGLPAILSYAHDGIQTVSTSANSRASTTTLDGFAAVGRFGGGNFAIPFWCGNEHHSGDVAEVIAFNRCLDEATRAGIELYLAQKYGLRTVKVWE